MVDLGGTRRVRTRAYRLDGRRRETGTRFSFRGATTRSLRRPATISTTSTSWPDRCASGKSRTTPTTSGYLVDSPGTKKVEEVTAAPSLWENAARDCGLKERRKGAKSSSSPVTGPCER